MRLSTRTHCTARALLDLAPTRGRADQPAEIARRVLAYLSAAIYRPPAGAPVRAAGGYACPAPEAITARHLRVAGAGTPPRRGAGHLRARSASCGTGRDARGDGRRARGASPGRPARRAEERAVGGSDVPQMEPARPWNTEGMEHGKIYDSVVDTIGNTLICLRRMTRASTRGGGQGGGPTPCTASRTASPRR